MNENDNWIIENCSYKDPDECLYAGRYSDGGDIYCMHGYETTGYLKCPYERKPNTPPAKRSKGQCPESLFREIEISDDSEMSCCNAWESKGEYLCLDMLERGVAMKCPFPNHIYLDDDETDSFP